MVRLLHFGHPLRGERLADGGLQSPICKGILSGNWIPPGVWRIHTRICSQADTRSSEMYPEIQDPHFLLARCHKRRVAGLRSSMRRRIITRSDLRSPTISPFLLAAMVPFVLGIRHRAITANWSRRRPHSPRNPRSLIRFRFPPRLDPIWAGDTPPQTSGNMGGPIRDHRPPFLLGMDLSPLPPPGPLHRTEFPRRMSNSCVNL